VVGQDGVFAFECFMIPGRSQVNLNLISFWIRKIG